MTDETTLRALMYAWIFRFGYPVTTTIVQVNPPLAPTYTGPHLFISGTDKNFKLDFNDKQNTVSIDRVEPA
ncbi:hypothetical protein NPIL_41971 [Nephila pilipes]|uniref:Uncharacterized protein n=1 Tax=Nephila pilipes TaxID=299642 RepID=A0A8X6U443_NEPPI|nr:hypothetical protein NPIL_41971 [Nephila pilipes]